MPQTEAIRVNDIQVWSPVHPTLVRTSTSGDSSFDEIGKTRTLPAIDSVASDVQLRMIRPMSAEVPEIASEHLDAVITRIEDGFVYFTARRPDKAVGLRMSCELFPQDLRVEGAPIRVSLAAPNGYKRIVVEARQVQRRENKVAREIMDWVDSL